MLACTDCGTPIEPGEQWTPCRCGPCAESEHRAVMRWGEYGEGLLTRVMSAMVAMLQSEAGKW